MNSDHIVGANAVHKLPQKYQFLSEVVIGLVYNNNEGVLIGKRCFCFAKIERSNFRTFRPCSWTRSGFVESNWCARGMPDAPTLPSTLPALHCLRTKSRPDHGPLLFVVFQLCAEISKQGSYFVWIINAVDITLRGSDICVQHLDPCFIDENLCNLMSSNTNIVFVHHRYRGFKKCKINGDALRVTPECLTPAWSEERNSSPWSFFWVEKLKTVTGLSESPEACVLWQSHHSFRSGSAFEYFTKWTHDILEHVVWLLALSAWKQIFSVPAMVSDAQSFVWTADLTENTTRRTTSASTQPVFSFGWYKNRIYRAHGVLLVLTL